MDKKKNQITVLFTACCGWPTCGTIDTLRRGNRYDYRIIGVDCSPNPAARNYVDLLLKVPRFYEDGYIDELLDICISNDVRVLVPLISDEIPIISENIDTFEQHGISVLMSGKDSMLDTANNKWKLDRFLAEKGIDLMPKSIPLTELNVDEALYELGYPDKPVCLKCIDACGSSGFRIVDDRMTKEIVFARSRAFRINQFISRKQLIEALDYLPDDFMLQEYLEGEELGTICLVDHGRTIYSPSHRNISMELSTATYCELVDDPEANSIVTMLNSLLRLDGNIGYDFKRDREGRLRLMEINPRISATVSLVEKAGLNIVELGILHAMGEDVDETIVPDYGIRLMRNYGTLYEKEGVPLGR